MKKEPRASADFPEPKHQGEFVVSVGSEVSRKTVICTSFAGDSVQSESATQRSAQGVKDATRRRQNRRQRNQTCSPRKTGALSYNYVAARLKK